MLSKKRGRLEDLGLKRKIERYGTCRNFGLRIKLPIEVIKLQEERPEFDDNVTVMPGIDRQLELSERAKEAAKDICRVCPVRRECFTYTTNHGLYAPIQEVVYEERLAAMRWHPSMPRPENVRYAIFGQK